MKTLTIDIDILYVNIWLCKPGGVRRDEEAAACLHPQPIPSEPAMKTKAEILKIDRRWIGAPDSRFNPTVALFLIAGPGFALGAFAMGTGALPVLAGIFWQTFCLYLSFTVLHDAMHGTAHRSKKVGNNLGRVCGLMLFTPLPLFRGVHHAHHGHTNDPERDPDLFYTSGSAWMWTLTSMAGLYFYRWHFYQKSLWRNPAERREAITSDVLLGILLVGALAAAPSLVLAAWLVPVTLVTFWLKYTFDYLPHHPHTQQGRFYDTRISPGRIANVLLLGQNYHLIHHLWTTVPWYRYQQVFQEVEPELRKRQCPIGWDTEALAPVTQDQVPARP